MTTRGRVLVVGAFVLAAALCGSAAVALVVAGDDDAPSLAALPAVSPTALPSAEPTSAAPTPTPSSAPTTVPTPSPTPVATPSRTASPAPRPSTRVPTPTGTPVPGLSATATVAEASGATAFVPVHVKARATDGDGSISLLSLDWGDGSPQVSNDPGTACSPAAKAPADCRNFAWSHPYPAAGRYTITLWFVSGLERSRLQLPKVTIS